MPQHHRPQALLRSASHCAHNRRTAGAGPQRRPAAPACNGGKQCKQAGIGQQHRPAAPVAAISRRSGAAPQRQTEPLRSTSASPHASKQHRQAGIGPQREASDGAQQDLKS